ncbi:hypothetical protein Cob_v004930 [Colletotrichum orbiculare MAFF 240422]|uniref:Uncharacterized protein n=1 Tax=Colletotrichum orbiculare (strain 104-T / ATCC 96160 / CBS 514.97 / LARS 414 / MAFF 240422) TaxID=1213857 RepID=N4VG59_COLOR|nr:hypothetical protein Cob_v004930 [Colletotrichum orbiculare MAFF 240422]
MKLLHTAACALMASQLAVGAPLADTDGSKSLVEFRTVNDAFAVKATLERRQNTCLKIARALRAIGTSQVVIAFMSIGSDLAEVVCRLAGGINCEDWARPSGLGSTSSSRTDGAVPETGMKRDENGGYSSAMRDFWENALISDGLAFDDPKLLARIHFSGLVDSETGKKHEIIANHFEGNNTVLHLPGLDQQALASRDLSKRVGAAGFKISYTTRVQSLLTRSHQQEMSGFVASAWAIAAENYRLEDYIGFAETDHSANFYYRIIPELYGFGLNYESVDICGGMASLL